MFGFFGKLLLILLTPVVAAAAYASWLLLWPVSESNVATRIEHGCYIAAVIKQFDGRKRPLTGGRDDVSFGQCGCFGEQVTRIAGAAIAAEAGESVREIILLRITKGASSPEFRARNRLSEADRTKTQVLEAAGRRAASLCREASAG